MNFKALAALLGLTTLLTVGCGAGDDGTGASDDHLETKPAATAAKPKGPLSDADLAAALASAPKELTEEDANGLVNATLRPLATTARLKLLNDFIKFREKDESEGRDLLSTAMEGIFWGTPRDLVSSPPGFGGQTMTTTTSVDAGIAGPSRLTIKGDAKAAYTLDFMVSNVKVSGIQIPAGANPSATAKVIKAALAKSNKKITDSIGQDKTFDAIGGDHSISPFGVDDVEISVSRGTVVILVAQNG